MGICKKWSALLAAASMLAGAPNAATAASPTSEAAKLRQLDIMLMVTSLRCRFGPENFQTDYSRFSTNQNHTMQHAFRTLHADYATRMGPVQANRAIDHLSVGMANTYGQGHPWLDCGALRETTRHLADTTDRAMLIAAADELLAASPTGQRLALHH